MSCYLNWCLIDIPYWVKLVCNCIFNCSQKLFSVSMVCSIKRITLLVSTFCCCPASMMEVVWKFFGCCFCCSVDWLRDWFINDWFLLDESCFKLSLSSCRCLICLLNPSSLVLLVDELDRDGGSPLLFLMFSAFSCSIVVLCRVVIDIFVLLQFLSKLFFLNSFLISSLRSIL